MTPPPETILSLNGVRVSFEPGETLYEIASRHGHMIPTLCYDPRLEPFGACRLCAVELRGARNPVASCTTLAAADMEVQTDTPELEQLRQTLLEMVVSENPHLAVDPLRSYSSQELYLLAQHYGIANENEDTAERTRRFAGATSGHSRLDDPNPFLLRDYDLCISCYRCVRVCAEQEGDYAISVKNRGFHTRITVEFDGHLRDSACTFCGQCVQTCPTGALADKKALRFAPE